MEVLQIGGVSCRELADRFGTPLYAYDSHACGSDSAESPPGKSLPAGYLSFLLFRTSINYCCKYTKYRQIMQVYLGIQNDSPLKQSFII